MPEHFQEIPGVRGREEYDEAAELRLAAEKVKQLAVQHESDWAHAKNTAEFRVKEKSVCFFQENVHFGFSLVKWERMIETSIFFCEI